MQDEVVKSDFHEEGKHHWTLNHAGYRVVVKRVGEHVEVTIRAKLDSDPDGANWKRALKITNAFYMMLQIAEEQE
jgi:hypothetical protein